MIFGTSNPSFFGNQLHLSTSLKGFERHGCHDGRISTDLKNQLSQRLKVLRFAWDFQTLGYFLVCRGLPSYKGIIQK